MEKKKSVLFFRNEPKKSLTFSSFNEKKKQEKKNKKKRKRKRKRQRQRQRQKKYSYELLIVHFLDPELKMEI
jgi:hypothetical protein